MAQGPSSSSTRSLSARVVGSLIYPLWLRRDHPHYRHYAREFTANQFLPGKEIERLQMAKLRTQLLHAFRNVPFYRRRFEQCGITPLDIHTLDDFAQLPPLTKREIQDHAQELLATNVPASARVQNQTGGSTGSPLQFWVDHERFDSRRASTDRHNQWAGLLPGDWHAHLWGSRFDVGTRTRPHIGWKERLLYRNLTLNTSLISDADLEEFLRLLRRVRPQTMVAYAQSAAMFARYCERKGIDDIRFRSIITTAEMLLPEQRTSLERVFGASVYNRYGCREVSVIASECSHHTGMHLNSDALIVEVVPIPGTDPSLGKVVITDLLNRAMPLLRYEIGDLASIPERSVCACGRSLPRIQRIEGRITDFLVTADDRRISGISLALLAGDMPQVRQMQFVQQDRKHIQLRVVAGEGYGADTVAELQRRLFPYLQGQTELSIITVDAIAKEPSGKYRYVKSFADAPREETAKAVNR
jgi:phenylacetate-CoA ligase